MASTCPPPKRRSAFTLVEIMIVVVIIGLLAALGVPAVMKAQKRSAVTTFINDLKKIQQAVDMYETENGRALQDYGGGVQPVDLIPYLTSPDFTGTTPLGGQWDWDNHTTYYRISVIPMDEADIQLVDDAMDDGDTSTGLVQNSGGFRYYTWNQ